MKNKWMFLTLLFLLLAATFIIGYHSGKNVSEPQEITDTITVTDTLWRDTTIFKDKPIPKYIKVVKTDTVFKDTVITKESKTYEDTLCNEGDTIQLVTTISGYEASLDSVSAKWKKHKEIVTNTITITKMVKEKSKINYGLQVGYGIGLKDKKFQPYIGLGLQYNF